VATLARLLKSLQAILEGEDYILEWSCFHLGVQALGLRSEVNELRQDSRRGYGFETARISALSQTDLRLQTNYDE